MLLPPPLPSSFSLLFAFHAVALAVLSARFVGVKPICKDLLRDLLQKKPRPGGAYVFIGDDPTTKSIVILLM